MKIRLGAFHHERLDLNGDLGNLLVLSHRLNAYGFDCEVVELTGQNFERELGVGLDFAFLGHGSKAAWLAIKNEDVDFESAVLATIDRGVDMLAVASGFEMLVEFGALVIAAQLIERRSEFVSYEWNNFELLGYLNADKNLPAFYAYKNIYATMLHGPVLAKNPELADFMIEGILKKRGASIHKGERSVLVKIDELSEAARAVAKSMIH